MSCLNIQKAQVISAPPAGSRAGGKGQSGEPKSTAVGDLGSLKKPSNEYWAKIEDPLPQNLECASGKTQVLGRR